MAITDKDYLKTYEPLWGSWYIEDLIGEGSYGKVYKIYKDEWGYRYESALKLITIPTKYNYGDGLDMPHDNEEALERYFEGAVKSIVNEIRLLYSLRGNSHIISYEDHSVEKRKDNKVGWDILIRMEYATPLAKHIIKEELTRGRLIKLGIDICSALEACIRKGIIHRDIKDENIFVSKDGMFKLGDFGISRELSKSGIAASIKGTPLYMAPEVYKCELYDARADLYSLGIVLYKFLNHGRLPFLPNYSEELKYKDGEVALGKRMSGEKFTLPVNAKDLLGEAVLKACAYNKEDRYKSANEMKKALEAILKGLGEEQKNEVLIKYIDYKNSLNKSDSIAHLPETVTLMDDYLLNEAKKDIQNKNFFVNEKQRCIEISENKRENPKNNTFGNIVNGGLLCAQSDFIYYADMSDGNKIKKCKPDGSDCITICEDNAWFVNVVGNWIYYSNASDGDKLYKINIDGKERTILSSNSCWELNVLDGWIYYSNESDNFKVYKINTDGDFNIKVNDDKSYNINVVDGWIYYVNKIDNGRIYKMLTDGSRRTALNDDESEFINVYEGFIYFCNKSDSRRIYKIDIYGDFKIRLIDDFCSNINVANDWIYYCNKSDDGKLYKIRIDGNERTKINDDRCDYINIAGDFIYYCNKSEFGKQYKIKTDGTCRTKIEAEEDDDWFYL